MNTLSGEFYTTSNLVAERERESDELAAAIKESVRDCDVAHIRHIADAIKAIPKPMFSEAMASHLAAVLSAKISESQFAHWDMAQYAIQSLDDAHDVLGAA